MPFPEVYNLADENAVQIAQDMRVSPDMTDSLVSLSDFGTDGMIRQSLLLTPARTFLYFVVGLWLPWALIFWWAGWWLLLYLLFLSLPLPVSEGTRAQSAHRKARQYGSLGNY